MNQRFLFSFYVISMVVPRIGKVYFCGDQWLSNINRAIFYDRKEDAQEKFDSLPIARETYSLQIETIESE